MICVKCQLQLQCVKTGVAVESMTSFGSYELYAADLHECKQCGLLIVGSMAATPISHHFEAHHSSSVANYKARGLLVRFWANIRERDRYFMVRKARCQTHEPGTCDLTGPACVEIGGDAA